MQDSFKQIDPKDRSIAEYPWIKKIWGQLERATKNNRLPQSVIISGPKNIGLETLLDSFSQGIICETDDLEPCNNCNNCLLADSSSHPDLLFLGEEDKGNEVNIENIRNSIEFLSSKPLISKRKLLRVNLHRGFSYSAISAILKILEEPPDNGYLVLRIDNLGRLPKTIVSRCQVLQANQPTCEMVANWYEGRLSKQIDEQSINGLRFASYFLGPEGGDTDLRLYEVADCMTAFLQSLCYKRVGFENFLEKLNDLDCDSILGGVELALYLILLAQYRQKPSTIFIDKRKASELKTLGEKIETEKLLNLLGYIAYLKRLCFNSQGIKASDISDLIFSNILREVL